MVLIEIDGLPFLNMGGSFHGELFVIARGYFTKNMVFFDDLLGNSTHGLVGHFRWKNTRSLAFFWVGLFFLPPDVGILPSNVLLMYVDKLWDSHEKMKEHLPSQFLTMNRSWSIRQRKMCPVELQLLLRKTMVVACCCMLLHVVACCCSAVYFLFGGEIKKTAEICGLVGSGLNILPW